MKVDTYIVRHTYLMGRVDSLWRGEKCTKDSRYRGPGPVIVT